MASDPKNTEPPTDPIHHKSSSSDLFSSAKILAGAAKSSFSHDGAAFDKPKVAEAGEDVVEAASEYGKLKEKGYGSYVDKAEGYLHQLHSPDQKPAHSQEKSTPGGKSTAPDEESAPPEERKSTVPDEESAPEEGKSAGGFGGFGDYAKKAEGFFK